MNWITLVSLFTHKCEEAFHCLHIFESPHSCFNWISLCLLFFLCWLYECMKMIKTFCLILSTTTLVKYSIHLVSVWSFVSPFELLSISMFIWIWCLSMSVEFTFFVWMLISLFLEPSTICCCMNFYLALESRKYSHINVGWIQVGENNVYVLILWLVWG